MASGGPPLIAAAFFADSTVAGVDVDVDVVVVEVFPLAPLSLDVAVDAEVGGTVVVSFGEVEASPDVFLEDFSSIRAAAFSSRSTFSFFRALPVVTPAAGSFFVEDASGESFLTAAASSTDGFDSFETTSFETSFETTSFATTSFETTSFDASFATTGTALDATSFATGDATTTVSFSETIAGLSSDLTAGFSVRRAFSFFSISAPTPGFASGFASVDVTVDETVASTVAASLTIALSSTNDVAVGICTTASTAATDSLLTTPPCEFDSLLTVFATAAAAAFVLATSAVGLGASCDVVAVSYAAIAAASAVFCASALDAPGEVVDFLASADDEVEVKVEIGSLFSAGDVSVELFLTASATGLGASVDAGGDGDSGVVLVGAAAAVEASRGFPGSAFLSAS
mmetsp:Transcript_13420/g.36728  ORF Transcript_13420/g.36728 Transcript_13420/m.36728 type:complete len:400 (-) Transcript_13420:915-2114(-)